MTEHDSQETQVAEEARNDAARAVALGEALRRPFEEALRQEARKPVALVKRVAQHDATSFGWQLVCLMLADVLVRHGETIMHAAGLVS
jgi:hypothetical protein